MEGNESFEKGNNKGRETHHAAFGRVQEIKIRM
jgi:hypothetical protein